MQSADKIKYYIARPREISAVKTSPLASQAHHWKHRLGLYGDIPTLVMRACMRLIPSSLDNFFLGPVVLMVYLLAGNQRRVVMKNLHAMHEDWAYTERWVAGYRVFWNFSRTYVDTLRCRHSGKNISWQVEGSELLAELAQEQRGILIVTAHMGNYDLAAQYFTKKLARTMHVVRAPERTEQMQSMRTRYQDDQVKTHFNMNDASLGPRLARLLMDGELVAVQADRVVGDVSPMQVEVEPRLMMQIPRGPWVLSCLKGVACLQTTVTRMGYYEYRISMKLMPPSDALERIQAQQLWGATIMKTVRKNWSQWYVFEPIFTRSVIDSPAAPMP
jgi:lauroyl/myristoyl acyltransferase